MNLIALSDQKLSALRHKVVQEVSRRTKAAAVGRDAAAIIHGNEMAQRAITIAAAGRHSILLLGPANSGKTMMRAVALELGLSETVEYRPCPCGNRNDSRTVCNCTVKQIERHISKMPMADMTVEMMRPSHRDMGRIGTTLDHIRRHINDMTGYHSLTLDDNGRNLFKAAIVEVGLDPAAQEMVIAIARTVANLDRSEHIQTSHLCEAINYRPFWR